MQKAILSALIGACGMLGTASANTPPTPSEPQSEPACAAPALDTWVEQKISPSQSVKAFEDYLFTLQGEDADREGTRTDALLIVHRSKIVYERYARGFDESKPHLSWSMAKSMTSTLIGNAVKRGLVDIKKSICTYIDTDKHCDLTVENFLEFGSGLDWKETYEGESNQESSVLAMLYGQGAHHMTDFVLSHGSVPQRHYEYSTGDTVVTAAALQGAVQKTLGERYPWIMLFEPVGIQSAKIERDAQGAFVGGSYTYLTARDFARLGLLWLQKGCWGQQKLVPDGWMDWATSHSEIFLKTSQALLKACLDSPETADRCAEQGQTSQQGRGFWLNLHSAEHGVKQRWMDAPSDTFAALGHWGQSIFVIPSKELVLVRLADDRDKSFDKNRYLKLALAMVEGEKQ